MYPPSGIAASDVPPEIQSAFESSYSRHAFLIKEGDVYSVIDMDRLTRRCVLLLRLTCPLLPVP